ncbi:MAG: hypothetical protein WAM60_26685, partial [Candidatus Promineifilaceae bacterium]
MKRLIWILLLVFAGLLVACNSGSSTDATPASTEAPQEEATPTEEAMQEPSGSGSIAVLLPDSASSARWEADDRRFFEQAFDAAGVDYTIVNAEG